jgi:hypothetical protein
MKRILLSLAIALLTGSQDVPAQIISPGVAYYGTTYQPGASGPYFGQTPPGTTPVRFAPSKIPQGAWGITFSPDGLECFITRIINDTQTLLTSKEAGGAWPDLTVAPFSGTFFDMESHITPDGTRMYFGSERPWQGLTPGFLYQWYVDKTGSGWSEPKPMDPPLFGELMMYPSVANNKNMYYTASDGVSKQWIALARYAAGAYQEPVALSDIINSTLYPAHPFIAPDESYIMFDAVTDTTNWARDLYICFRKPDSTWTHPINMGTMINNATYSMFPFVSRDSKYFFFYRDNYMMWMSTSFIEKLRPRYGDWLGEAPPDTIPVMFAKDFISSNPNQVYSCTFSPDGNEFYYSNYSGSYNRIWKTERINNTWTKPALASFPQSPWTIEPNFSPDGSSLYFVSTMPDTPPGPPYNPSLRIWTMERSGTGWNTPHVLQGPFSDSIKMFPSVAENRNLYFTETNNNSGLIYRSVWNFGGGYETPVKLDSAINRFVSQAHPFIAPDESFLIFDASETGPPEWKTAIYISCRNQDGTWKEARKLPASVNATGGEYCGYLTPDKKYLFFARNSAEGGTNLWWVKADNILQPLGTNDMKKDHELPELGQNYPNPSNTATTIRIRIKKGEHVALKLYNVYGREEKTLLDEVIAPGQFSIRVPTSDLKPGVYSYSLFLGKMVMTKKMIVLHD